MSDPINDRRTPNYNLPSPGPNNLDVDVLRLIEALQTIDTVLKANADAIGLRALASAIKAMPAGDIVGTTDAQRLTGKVLDTKVATLASASTVDIGLADANRIGVTGTTTINSFGAASAGVSRTVTFAGALTLSHSANLLLPGAANIATAAGDVAELESVTPGTWRCTWYQRASAMPVLMAGNQTIAGVKTFSDDVYIRNGAAEKHIFLGSSGGYFYGSEGFVGFYKAGGGQFSFDVATGNTSITGSFTASGNVTAYSDIRLKTDLNKIANALGKVCAINGYTYTRTDSGERQTGLVAQEVRDVLPEAVMEDQEGGILSLAYGNLVGLLVEAIKELKAEVDQLKAGG